MFVRGDHALEGAGGAAALSFGRAPAAIAPVSIADRLRNRVADIDLVPDLGSNIGSADWWRGAATCAALCVATIALAPGLDRPIYRASADVMTGADFDEARTQSIAPLAYGGNSGRRLAPTALVTPLTDTPERPILELTTTLSSGPALAAALERAMDGHPHSLVDVSNRQVGIEVSGPDAAAALNAGCPLDLDVHAFPVSMCTRTVLAKTEIVLWRTAPELFRVEVWRSFAAYAWSFLAEASREFRA